MTTNDSTAINCVWVLLAAFLVMFMKAGFALIETGMCRAKNAAHTMAMNLLVYPLGMIGFFACGFAFMCGGVITTGDYSPASNFASPLSVGGSADLTHMFTVGLFGHTWGLLGHHGFFLAGLGSNTAALICFFYMMVFMDITATIPTGACAERWRFKSFTIFSLLVGAFIYAFYGCWMWGGGWLAQLGSYAGLGHGAVDFAGSSVVHLQGGTLALVMVKLLGPRIGKYGESGRPRPIFGHHMPMVLCGTLLLAFGWFGFTSGSTLAVSSGRIGLIAVNTALASAASTLAATLFMWKLYGNPDPSVMCNGLLGGLVAISAACAFVSPFVAFVIGAVAGVIVAAGVLSLERRGLDDPVGAISVHGIAGVWGMLALGLFADGTFGAGYNGVAGNVTGLFFGDHSPRQLFAQCLAIVVCIAWNLVIGGGAFLLVGRFVKGNRVSVEVELNGLDVPELGVSGYPEFLSSFSDEKISSTKSRINF